MTTRAKTMDRLSAEERRELSDEEFGIPQTREFPLTDAAHVRAAESYFRYAPDNYKTELARRILRRAEQFGVEVCSETFLDWAARKR